MLGHDLTFWLSVLGAIIWRVLTAEVSKKGLVAIAMGSILAALVFTNPVLIYMELPVDTYKVPVAVLLVFTGEGLMRSIVAMVSSPDKLV
jgi:hypothetical protein